MKTFTIPWYKGWLTPVHSIVKLDTFGYEFYGGSANELQWDAIYQIINGDEAIKRDINTDMYYVYDLPTVAERWDRSHPLHDLNTTRPSWSMGIITSFGRDVVCMKAKDSDIEELIERYIDRLNVVMVFQYDLFSHAYYAIRPLLCVNNENDIGPLRLYASKEGE